MSRARDYIRIALPHCANAQLKCVAIGHALNAYSFVMQTARGSTKKLRVFPTRMERLGPHLRNRTALQGHRNDYSGSTNMDGRIRPTPVASEP